jgi:hypothetical protein
MIRTPLFLTLMAAFAVTACTTTDSKYAEMKEKNLSCPQITALHKQNEAFVDKQLPIAKEKGSGAAALAGFGGIIGLVGAAQQAEIYKYRDNLRENEALRRLAGDKKCPAPMTKYPIGMT